MREGIISREEYPSFWNLETNGKPVLTKTYCMYCSAKQITNGAGPFGYSLANLGLLTYARLEPSLASRSGAVVAHLEEANQVGRGGPVGHCPGWKSREAVDPPRGVIVNVDWNWSWTGDAYNRVAD